MNKSENYKQWIQTLTKQFKKTQQVNTTENTYYNTLKKIKLNHFSHFLNTGFPIVTDPHWKFTNINSCLKPLWNPTPTEFDNSVNNNVFTNDFCNFPNVHKINLHNGVFTKSSLKNLPAGLKICTPKTLSPEFPAWSWITNQKINNNKNGFYYLAGAFCVEGYILYVPESYCALKPLHIHVSFDKSYPSNLRNLNNFIFLEKHSKISIVQSIAAPKNTILNTVTRSKHKAHSTLKWLLLDQVLPSAVCLNQTDCDLEEQANLNKLSVHLGSGISRESVQVNHLEKNSNSTLLSLSLLKNTGSQDQRFFTYHTKKKGYSRQFSRGIVNDNAKNIFYGKIYIDTQAKQTNCAQSVKNLLLSNTAHSYMQPELEVYCGEVTAKHGATSGEFSKDDIFYLQSRGLGVKIAVELLLMGYVKSVVDQFTQTELKKHILNHIQKHKSLYLNL